MASEDSPRQDANKPVDPRHAASLVLVRDGENGPEVLMGRRPMGARFMPGIYVFPGGAVETQDFDLETDRPLEAHVAERVQRQADKRLAQALGWTAIRETWEETGVMLAASGAATGAPGCPALEYCAASDLTPDLSALDYLMRAVTPAYVPMRFNTRFFIADGAGIHGSLQACDELEDVGWWRFEDALNLTIVNVTELVLETAQRYWREKPPPDSARPVTMFTQITPGEVVLRDE